MLCNGTRGCAVLLTRVVMQQLSLLAVCALPEGSAFETSNEDLLLTGVLAEASVARNA